jgi:hypothetical protein
MKHDKLTFDEKWVARHFPTKAARMAADRAADKLDVHKTMAEHLDVWLAEYFRNGGTRGR